MSDEVTINFTLEELEVLNIVLTKLQELEIPPETKEEIDNEINKFIENLLIKIAKVKLEQNIIKEILKI
jgi:hypothetical protein